MCKILYIKLWVLSRGNHKVNSVECYRRFLNKVQIIHSKSCGIYLTIVTTVKTAQYAWNGAIIDNMDIIRSMSAVERDFRLPLDLDFTQMPNLTDISHTPLFQ